MKLGAKWDGPWTFLDSGNSMFDSEVVDRPGVYLWTFEREGEYWINYVGIHRHSMLERNEEHLRLFLGGRYTVYFPDLLIHGEKRVAFTGAARMQGFLKDYESRHRQTIAQLERMQLFFSDFDSEVEFPLLKRIESSIILELRKSLETSSFLDNERLSVKIKNRDIEVSFVGADMLHGLPERVYA